MSYENLDALLNETDVNAGELPSRVLQLRGKEFTLPAELNSKAVMKYARHAETNPVVAADAFLLGMLGEEQYDELLDLVPRLEQLVIVAQHIMQFYAPNENTAVPTNPNLKARQIRKK